MKVEIEKKKFIEALNIGGTFAGNSKALPILDCVKIKVKNVGMSIISSDNENAISKKCEIVSSDFKGDFCVGYKSLMQYVKLVSGDLVEMVLSDDMKMVSIKHKKGSLELPLMNADEFPLLSVGEVKTEVSIDSALVNNWIVDAQRFVSDDMLRPQMECVYLYRRDGELGCVGSDGHKMFYDHVTDNGESFEYLISRKSVKSICNAAKTNDTLTFRIGESNVAIVGDGVTVISRCLNSRYPNHKSVLPKESSIQVIVNRKDMIESVERCLVGASQASCLVKMSIDGMNMTLCGEDIDFSVSAKEELMVSANGNIEIGFKATYILEILNTLATDEVLICMTDHTRAALFREYKEGNIFSEKTCLVMPMMLN